VNLFLQKRCLLQESVYEKKLISYEHYHFAVYELLLNVLLGVGIAFMIGHFFYDSIYVSLGFLGFLPFFLKYRSKEYGQRRRDELSAEFKDAIMSLSANQKAGYSIENAFVETCNDMELLYGKHSIIYREFDYIRRGIENNQVVEDLLLSLGNRSGDDDIRQFGSVFAIAKRSGGNLTSTIDMTASVIEQRISVEEEIAVMISAKKMESNIMSVVPIMMILYMKITSDGFFDGLYHNLAGILIMSMCLAVYIGAYLISRRLVDIRI